MKRKGKLLCCFSAGLALYFLLQFSETTGQELQLNRDIAIAMAQRHDGNVGPVFFGIIFVIFLVGLVMFLRRGMRSAPIPEQQPIKTGELFPHGTKERPATDVDETIPRKFRSGIRGVVRNVEKREMAARYPGGASEDYLSFCLETADEQGNVAERIPVEMRARSIPGRVIRDGDKVVINGKRNRQGLLVPSSIYDVNKNLDISGKSHGLIWHIMLIPLSLISVFAFFGIFIGIYLAIAGNIYAIPVGLACVAFMVIYYLIYGRG